MKILSKIKIGGHLFDVEYQSEDEVGYEHSGSKFGWRNKIRLQKDMAQSKRESVLFHEILEELNYQHEYKLDHQVLSSIAEGFYQVLKDNGWLK